MNNEIRELSDAELNTVTGGSIGSAVGQIAHGVAQALKPTSSVSIAAENAWYIGQHE
jgi:bacteriocin-like protein